MSTRTGIATSPRFLGHDTGPGHPECPERLEAVLDAIRGNPVGSRLIEVEPRAATVEELCLIHDAEYVGEIRDMCARGGGRLDFDTPLSADSYEVALLSAGTVLTAVDAVLEGEVDNAFALVRPPGHHARPTRGMGFCLFNNVAVAAQFARRVPSIARVLIVDWDVHHGNGTQDAFYRDGNVFYFSTHQHPHYPGTGRHDESGIGDGAGATLNVPLTAGSGDDAYLSAFEDRLVPAADAFRPDLVMISAGFDAHALDPLAGMLVTADGFGALTDVVRSIADRHCDGRLSPCLREATT